MRLSLWVALVAGCGDLDAFYDDPIPGLADLPLGAVARLDRIGHTSRWTLGLKAGTSSPRGAQVYRVLYRTVGLDGEPDVASARVAVPDDLPPGDLAPIVAHLHGTVGLADRCAPSRDGGFGFESSSNPNAARMVAAGAIVVAPDYLGLGPPGPHAYVAIAPTASSVLDAIRAAGDLRDPDHDVRTVPAERVVLEGHSQGGHAVLATLRDAASYAPELPIVAAVALAPPGAPADLLPELAGSDRWGGFLGMAVRGWTDAHPEIGPVEAYVDDDKLLERLEEDCLLGLSGWMDDPAADLLAPDVARAWAVADFAAHGFEEVVATEDPGVLVTDAELLVVHGTEDDLLPIGLTRVLTERIAAGGTDAVFVPIDGGDHLLLPHGARDVVLPFLEGALR
jgi:pimeloyl-ACP methyl ester carboxylesterase